MDYLTRQVAAHELHGASTVVDLGGRDINGSPRHLFPAATYTVLDVHEGAGVDVIADARDWAPAEKVDVVVCAEVLEHAPDVPGVLAAAKSWLRQGGHLLVTAASPGRAPHSGLDGGPVRPGEHYANVTTEELADALGDGGWYWVQVSSDPAHGDVYATACRR